METSPIITSKLNQDAKLHIITENTFLYCLYKGEKSLYMYNRNGREYFYIQQEGKIDLLVFKRYLVMVKTKYFTQENKKYIGQLMIYFSDVPSLHEKISKTPYQRKEISNLFKLYYKLKPSPYFHLTEEPKISISHGILAGVSISKSSFTGDSYPYLIKGIYANSVNFTGGYFLDLAIPRSFN